MTIVILTNIMTPYRKFFYDELYNECRKNNINFYVILMSDTEEGRHWHYDDLKTEYTVLLPHKTFKIGSIELHVNTGIKKLYKRIKPNVVICGGSYLYPAVWRTIQLRKKFIYETFEWSESHLNEERNYSRMKLRLRNFFRKNVISKFNNFWCAGRFSKSFIEKYAKDDSNYIFVPNLVHSEKFNNVSNYSELEKKEIRKKYNIKDGERVYITPARLIGVKGILEFLDLYKDCDTTNCVYLIAGDGELKDSIQSFIDKHNMNVRLVGHKDEEELLELYSISNGFILSSKSDANPLTCVEACWCKLPLLVSNHVGNYPEIINEDKNGFIFNYEDRDEAIDIINRFIKKSDEWYDNASKYSYDIANELYNPKTAIPRIIKETLEIYNKNNK